MRSDITKRLYAAVLARDDRAVGEAIAAGADPNRRLSGASADAFPEPGRKTTVLMAAAERGTPGAVAMLLEAGARPRAVDSDGATALIYAARAGAWREGEEEKVAALAKVSPIRAKDRKYLCAMSYACGVGEGNTGWKPGVISAIVAEARKKGHDIPALLRHPLLAVAATGNTGCAEMLLKEGASAFGRAGEGSTVLEAAVRGGGKMLRVLLSPRREERPSLADLSEPLYLSAWQGGAVPAETLPLLLEVAAELAKTAAPGEIAQFEAAKASAFFAALDYCCVEALLRAGVEPDAADRNGTTKLMAAAAQGDLALCGMLLRRGADPSRKNGRGKSARGFARGAAKGLFFAAEEKLAVSRAAGGADRGFAAKPAARRI